MIYAKACPRCRGDVEWRSETDGWLVMVCLSCGWRVEERRGIDSTYTKEDVDPLRTLLTKRRPVHRPTQSLVLAEYLARHGPTATAVLCEVLRGSGLTVATTQKRLQTLIGQIAFNHPSVFYRPRHGVLALVRAG